MLSYSLTHLLTHSLLLTRPVLLTYSCRHYKDEHNLLVCKQCAVGFYSGEGAIACSQCPYLTTNKDSGSTGTHSLTYSRIYSLIYSRIYSLIYSLIHSLTYSLTYSLTILLDCPLYKVHNSMFGIVYTMIVLLAVITFLALKSVKQSSYSLVSYVVVVVGLITGVDKLTDLLYLIVLPFWSLGLLVCAVLFLLLPMGYLLQPLTHSLAHSLTNSLSYLFPYLLTHLLHYLVDLFCCCTHRTRYHTEELVIYFG